MEETQSPDTGYFPVPCYISWAIGEGNRLSPLSDEGRGGTEYLSLKEEVGIRDSLEQEKAGIQTDIEIHFALKRRVKEIWNLRITFCWVLVFQRDVFISKIHYDAGYERKKGSRSCLKRAVPAGPQHPSSFTLQSSAPLLRCPSWETVSAVRLTNKTETGCKHSHQKRNTHQIRKKKTAWREERSGDRGYRERALCTPEKTSWEGI